MSDAPGAPAGSRLAFVLALADVPPARPDTRVVVLDAAWTPRPDDRADLLAARPLLGTVIEARDLFDESLERLDAWAEANRLPERLRLEDVTYWYRLRETMWRWLHERLLWRYALAAIATEPIGEVAVPPGEEAVADVARLLWGAALQPGPTGDAASTPVAATRSAGRPPTGLLRRVLRRLGRSGSAGAAPVRPPEDAEQARRADRLAERLAAILDDPRLRVVVLTNPRTYQRVGGEDGAREDPLFGAVIPGLREAGLRPIRIGTNLDHRRDDDWALLADDDDLLPQSLLQLRWAGPEDRATAEGAAARIAPALATLRGAPLDVDGVDLAPALVDALVTAATRILRADARTLPAVERLVRELRPAAILLAQEGIRTPWLIGGRRAGVPVFAVQHGILYPGHAGYPNRRDPALVLPARTFVYGDDEREVLLSLGSYRPDEVEVSGSPRFDLDRAATEGSSGAAAAERAAVRRELRVADGDRMLVISTINLRFVQQSHFAHTLARTLGGPLPGVHLVFKQHPGEFDDGPYRALVDGLAAAGGYPAPPVSVVKDVDLYRLLRAADAHLGALSTVLTEAVATGTPNLIAVVDRHADLLGYVEAGVATPVRDAADVRAALASPAPPDPAARAAFLARHFRAGDASGRIVEAVRSVAGARVAG